MRKTKTKQIDIAKYAEVSYQTVSAWCTGRAYPRADAMERICKFFGIKQSALTENHDEQNPETLLVLYFRSLSEIGKKKLLERAEELSVLCPKWRKYDG